MKTVFRAAIAAVSIAATGPVSGDCPLDLPYELLVDCIAVEWAGGTYPIDRELSEWIERQGGKVKAGESQAAEQDQRLRVLPRSPVSSR